MQKHLARKNTHIHSDAHNCLSKFWCQKEFWDITLKVFQKSIKLGTFSQARESDATCAISYFHVKSNFHRNLL